MQYCNSWTIIKGVYYKWFLPSISSLISFKSTNIELKMFKIINMHLSKKVALTTDGSYIKKVAQKVQELAVSKVSNCQRAISI